MCGKQNILSLTINSKFVRNDKKKKHSQNFQGQENWQTCWLQTENTNRTISNSVLNCKSQEKETKETFPGNNLLFSICLRCVGVLHQFSDIETQTKTTQQNVFICHRISNVSEEMCQAEREKESRKLEEKKKLSVFVLLKFPSTCNNPRKQCTQCTQRAKQLTR
jgi:hypothetical protein